MNAHDRNGPRRGFCGWFSREPQVLAIAPPLAHMGAPLADGLPLRCLEHPLGALALACPDEASCYQGDGLLVVCQGASAAVLAQLWRRLGPEACNALSGHFTFVLFDAHTRQGLVAVDRLASRSLFYQRIGRTLAFATSMEALARYPGAGREPDPQALFDYLYLDGASGPRPPLAGQRRLAPGECLHLHQGRVERRSYWRMRHTEHADTPTPHGQLLDALTVAFAEVDDAANVGVLSAGGPASTLVAARLQQLHGRPPPTYAIGFGDGDRAALARASRGARRLGSRHREWMLGPHDVIEAAGLLASRSDAPCGEPSAITALHAARLAREDGVSILASACGGAPLFGVDEQYRALRRTGGYERLPAPLRQLVLEPLLFGLGAPLPGITRLRESIELSMESPPERLRRDNRLLADGTAVVFERGFLAQVDTAMAAAMQEATWWQAEARHPVNRATALALGGDLPYRLLPAFGAACGAAGVAPMLPLLNDAVVALAARLAPGLKEGPAARRLMQRSLRLAGAVAAADAGQAPVLPLARWIRTDPTLRAFVDDSLYALGRRRIVRRAWIDLLLDRCVRHGSGQAARFIWQLTMLERWLARRSGTGASTDNGTVAANAASASFATGIAA